MRTGIEGRSTKVVQRSVVQRSVVQRCVVMGATVLLGLGGSAAVLAAPATAAACDPDTQTRGDFDGDGRTDAVVGMPFYGDGAGAVDVRYTGLPSVRLSAGSIGVGTGEGDSFGAALAVGDLDGDGCADLVIGASREGAFADPDAVGGYIGQVHIIFGSPTGLLTGSTISLSHEGSGNGKNFDDFGISLALSSTGSGGVHDLYVGAPGAIVGGHANAGAVHHYVITPGGSDRITISSDRVRSLNSAGVPGTAAAGDRFGEVLTPGGYRRGVVAAAPMRDVGQAVNAGTVWFLGVAADGSAGTSAAYSQATAGVPGSAETGDHFGDALSMRGQYLAVGAPGENAGRRKDTGMVQAFKQAAGGKLTPTFAYSQDSPGIPGKAEAGDRFGTAVAVGGPIRCQESVDVAIGSPGEDVGTRKNAGTITLLPMVGGGCQPVVLRQGSGLAGAAETGDEVGGVLGITRGRTDLDEDYADRLLIGVPLEDIGAKRDAGLVQSNQAGIDLDGTQVAALQYSGGYLSTERYGMVLSSASD